MRIIFSVLFIILNFQTANNFVATGDPKGLLYYEAYKYLKSDEFKKVVKSASIFFEAQFK